MEKNISNKSNWPTFDEITQPRIICFGVGNGSGSKLLQSYLDGHPQIYMIPGYQLMYLYPHWYQWKEELKYYWNWNIIIEALCLKHSSIIDSRNIPAHDGLRELGENRDQWIEIDVNFFKSFLHYLLDKKQINFKNFLLAIHYAYSYVRGEDLSQKRVLIYHLHVHEYVPKYMIHDFPDMYIIGLIRDPRSNIYGRYNSTVRLDRDKLNTTDSEVYYRRSFLNIWTFFSESLECLKCCDLDRVRLVRHEDMNYCLEDLMRSIAHFIEIDFHPCLLKSTFGGLLWWGSRIYDMKPMNKPNPRIISKDWQKQISPVDWFIIEGLFYDYCVKYGYEIERYKEKTIIKKFILFFALFFPMSYEVKIIKQYLNFKNYKSFYKASIEEAQGRVELKDYQSNAYYRHKWYNTSLNLCQEPWYKRILKKTLNSNQNNMNNLFLNKMIKKIYIIINSLRYLNAILVFPVNIIQRYILCVRQYYHLINKTSCLPEKLL